MSNNKLQIEEIIPCYATDYHKYLRPTAFMDYAQELAYRSATDLGFGYKVLIKENKAWVLSRFHIKFDSPVRWGDKVKIATWHKGLNGLYYIRDFSLVNSEGVQCISATSSWIVLDLEKRSLVRVDKVEGFMPEDTELHEDAIAEPCPKVMIPRGAQAEKLGEHVVNYSDVDCLGHTNNVRYVVWSMDASGADITFKRPCKELYINFIKETHLNDVVEIFRYVETAEDGSMVVIVEGRVDGATSFSCKLIY